MYKETKKAYMTVEASLLMPVILGGIIFTIFSGLYLYNVVTIKQAAYIAALRGSQVRGKSKDVIDAYVEQELENMLCGRILAGENSEIKIKVSSHKVSVQIRFVMNMPLFQEIFSKTNLWIMEGKAEAELINPVEIIRNVRKINGS